MAKYGEFAVLFIQIKSTPCFVSCRFQPEKKQRNKKEIILPPSNLAQ
jgi:hypothetical protein